MVSKYVISFLGPFVRTFRSDGNCPDDRSTVTLWSNAGDTGKRR